MSLPVVSGSEVVKALARAGFVSVSQKGSHMKMKHPSGPVAIVPMHKEVAQGTLRSILRQAKRTEEEFVSYLSSS